MDEKLTFVNGTEVEGHGIETDARLILYLYNASMTDMFNLLNNPENVGTITWVRYSDSGKWTGYKHLMSISIEAKMICASLRR